MKGTHLIAISALISLISACGSGTKNMPTPSPAPLVTSPTIISVTPTDGKISVPTNTTITATFSTEMDPTTINTSSFTLKQGATNIPGTVTYLNKVATFTPTSNLTHNAVYTATVSTDAKDSQGIAIETNYVWTFTIIVRDYMAWEDQGLNYTAPPAPAPFGSAYYPSIIYDANGFGSGTPTYKMWYADGNGSIFLVTSADGISWGLPTTMAGIINAHHAQVLYDANGFGSGTPKYKMWFWDITQLYSISAIATAESTDGINWTGQTALTQNAAAKLVFDDGVSWNRGSYGPVSLFYQPTATNTGTEPWNYTYVMYYNGTDGSHEDTGLAYSTDGLYWNAYTANPVLSGSLTGNWECASATYGTVYKDSVGFHYFYSGRGITDGMGGCTFPPSFEGIGYAFSTDGKTWVRSLTNPIFSISDGVSYRDERIYTPSVIDDGSGILKMYFSTKSTTGSVKTIGFATLQ